MRTIKIYTFRYEIGSVCIGFVLVSRPRTKPKLEYSFHIIHISQPSPYLWVKLFQVEAEEGTRDSLVVMASPMLFRGLPLLRFRPAARLLGLPRATFCSAAPSEPTQPEEKLSSADNNTTTLLTVKEPPKYHRWADPDYRKWKDKEDEILRDIEPILFLAKEILHSRRLASPHSIRIISISLSVITKQLL